MSNLIKQVWYISNNIFHEILSKNYKFMEEPSLTELRINVSKNQQHTFQLLEDYPLKIGGVVFIMYYLYIWHTLKFDLHSWYFLSLCEFQTIKNKKLVKVSISVSWFLGHKYSHHGWFEVTNDVTGPKVWKNCILSCYFSSIFIIKINIVNLNTIGYNRM